MFINTVLSLIYSATRKVIHSTHKGWGKAAIYALKRLISYICVKKRVGMIGSNSLGHEGPTLQISAQTKHSRYVKQFLHPRICLKMLISHDFEYAENGWSMQSAISEEIRKNMSETSDLKFIITDHEEKWRFNFFYTSIDHPTRGFHERKKYKYQICRIWIWKMKNH